MPSRFLCFFASLLIGFALHAQQDSAYLRAGSRLKTNSVRVVKFDIPRSEPGHNVLVLEVPFAQPQFIRPALASAAKGKLIEKVQLVYTTFAVSASFDQQTLNRKRLSNLYRLLPGAFDSPLTQWELVGQTGATSPEEGRDYFHGFVITWRPDASPELIRKEMLLLDSLFMKIAGGGTPGGEGTGLTPADSGSSGKIITFGDGSKITIDRDIPEDSLWMFIRPSGEGYSVVHAKYGDTSHTTIVVTEMSEMGVKRKRVWKLEEHKGAPPIRSGLFDLNLHHPDSVVLTVMQRNGWQNMLVVCDVTGSMSPYTAQVFKWLPTALSSNKCAGFVFFNDGDKKGGPKNVGKTGGIYGTEHMRYDSVYNTARKTMMNGDGGDIPENNLEALIWGIKNLPSNGDIVLIADNWATPRDLSLLNKINRPVHIILCGATGGINPEYLYLARQTKGTVHTLTQDVTNLSEMKEGDTVKIGPHTFVLVDEHFIALEMFNNF